MKVIIMNKLFSILILGLGSLLFSSLSYSHSGPEVPTPLNLKQLTTAFGWDLDNGKITTQKITDNLYVFFGMGGNIAVTVGSDGVLIVDDQFPELTALIEDSIKKLGGKKVDFAINTHWHFDHAEGNLAFGPKGTWLVAQQNSRAMMLDDHIVNLVSVSYNQKAYPKDALPIITYDKGMQFHFNGQQIDLRHYGPAHTTGDTAIIFRGSNAVHLGDVFNNAGYPFIDAGNGGTLQGLITFCSETLAEINEQTIVIPGHGEVTDYQTLKAYIDMLTTVRDRMLALIEQGATLDDVYKAKVTAEFDEKFGDNIGFINRSYMSLTHKIVDR